MDGNRALSVGAAFTVWTLGPSKDSHGTDPVGSSDDERRQHDMLNRFATLAACMLVPLGTAPLRSGGTIFFRLLRWCRPGDAVPSPGRAGTRRTCAVRPSRPLEDA